MNNWFANLRRALRSLFPRTRASDEAARQQAALLHWLEEQLAREREEVARQRADIERLLEENRALLNSLLGTAGVPPIETPRANAPGAPPIRRRTWPQIATTREIEAARLAARQARTEKPNGHDNA